MSAAPVASWRPAAAGRASPAARLVLVAMLLVTHSPCGAQPTNAARPPATVAGEAVTQIFDVKLANGRWVDGRPVAADTLRVKRGESVQLRWSSDVPMNLHLHGYDLAITLQAGVPTVTSFMASVPGRFPVASHGAGAGRERAVLYLEVLP